MGAREPKAILNLEHPHEASAERSRAYLCRAEKDVYGTKLHESRRLQGDVYPRPFIDQLCMWQVVADVRQPAWVHRDVNSAALHVVTVLCSTHGGVQCLTTETAVDFNRYAKAFSEGLQDLLAQPD